MNYSQTLDLITQGSYDAAVDFCKNEITTHPENKNNYWYLGLALLLKGDPSEAHATWLTVLFNSEAEQLEQDQKNLLDILETEASQRRVAKDIAVELEIRYQIQELFPQYLNNLLNLVILLVIVEQYSEEFIEESNVLELLSNCDLEEIEPELLIETLEVVLSKSYFLPSAIKLIDISIEKITTEINKAKLIKVLLVASHRIGIQEVKYPTALPLAEAALKIDPNNYGALILLIQFYAYLGDSQKNIDAAKHFCAIASTLPTKIFAQKQVLLGLIYSSRVWEETLLALDELENLILQISTNDLENSNREEALLAATASFPFNYFRDQPKQNRYLHNHLSTFCYHQIQLYAKDLIDKFSLGIAQRDYQSKSDKPLKIGYLSHTFRFHSVAWLARWLFVHHDPKVVDVHAYSLCCNPEHDPLHRWYCDNVPKMFKSHDSHTIAEQIFQDEIDILIDLDSLTLDMSFETLALKPAPVQVTWLGWDASGLPTIDYYIADKYVLPEDAQDYYTEKLWRLPDTYIAVDGFEIGVPSIRREDLDIPADAVVYLTVQTGSKQQPDTVKLQMEIVKAVPNSYFLIKESRDAEGIKTFYKNIAEKVGLEYDRLRFLPRTATEMNHRANLGIADIVLDTFPYNGATTTLETLWVGIPIVTRVGEQFAARNSYTMMMNAGITEGIAWTDAEYVEWGIKLGTNADLRKDISSRLKASRQTAPLWNGKQFTKNMEEAYQQMWQIYLENKS